MLAVKRCPMCGSENTIELTDEEYEKYDAYRHGGGYIQQVFPNLNAVEREFLKTGMCLKCQKEIFNNNKTNKIKPMWVE